MTFLPKGPVLEGQLLLTPSKMKKALVLVNGNLFIEALTETVTMFAYLKGLDDYRVGFNIENVTYGSLPVSTSEQQAENSEITEQFVLCFISNCIFSEKITEMDRIIGSLENCEGFKVRVEFVDSLRAHDKTEDYNTTMAKLLIIHKRAIEQRETLLPTQIFELALKALQVAGQTNNIQDMAKSVFAWLNVKLTFILENQRFLLKNLAVYEKSINQMRGKDGKSSVKRVIDLLMAILPTMGFKNESQLAHILNGIGDNVHKKLILEK